MKKDYRKPLVQKINFEYGDQVSAASAVYCDQSWQHMTTLDPLADCEKCDHTLIWLNTVSPF